MGTAVIPSHLQPIAEELRGLLTGKTKTLEDVLKGGPSEAFFLLRQGGFLAFRRDETLPVLHEGSQEASLNVFDLEGRPLAAFTKAWALPWHLYAMQLPGFLLSDALPLLSGPPSVLQKHLALSK